MADAARPLSDRPESRPAPSRPPRGRSLAHAVVTALVLVALMAVTYALGTGAFFVLATIVVLMALYEYLHAVRAAGRKPHVPFTIAVGAGILAAAWVQRPAYIAVAFAVATFGGLALGVLPGTSRAAPSDVAWSLLGLAWIAGGGAAAVSILALEPGGMALLIGTVAVTAADDVAAYFVGTSIGRHKLAPSISPNKSWEGFVGGALAALAVGAAVGSVVAELTVLEGVVLGAIVSVAAPFGDLVESRFKREVGIKDSSHLLPGHGGMLDRIDAIVFACPPIFLFLRAVVF